MQKNWKSIFVIGFVEFMGMDTFEFLSLVWLLSLYSSSPHCSRRGYLWHKDSKELSMSLGDWRLHCCRFMQTLQGSEAIPENCSWSPWVEHLSSLFKRLFQPNAWVKNHFKHNFLCYKAARFHISWYKPFFTFKLSRLKRELILFQVSEELNLKPSTKLRGSKDQFCEVTH